MFEKFDIDDKNIFKVCVVATMSSGKSTFINSIIGEEIMPEKNEACTARTMSVIDNDNALTKKAHIIRKNGAKEIVEINNREVMDRINDDEDIQEFLIETDISSIKNTSRALVLVDTPGVNNSGDERHGERTEQFLQQMDIGVIIYLLNATQLATNDDSILLQLVADHIKKNKDVRIIFVINKIDALDEETESIQGTVNIAKNYIEEHGISNPIIYPLSALAAKSLRMVLHRREMTKRELRKVGDIFEQYRSSDNSMLAYAMTDDFSTEIYEINDEEVNAEQLKRAIDNTGITAIEKRLETFMMELEQHYSPEIVIKTQMSQDTNDLYHKRFTEIMKYKKLNNESEFNSLKKQIFESVPLYEKNLSVSTSRCRIESAVDDAEICQGIETLIGCIERSKRKIFENFQNGNIPELGKKSQIYLLPEKEEQNCIHIRDIFLYSYDKTSWKEINYNDLYSKENNQIIVYLYNKILAEFIQLSIQDVSDMIAILDMVIPVIKTKVVGLGEGSRVISEINEYIKGLNIKADNEKESAKAAEEVLRKTYKGIVFDSEKEKDRVINLEHEILIYCKNLNSKSFFELRKKKNEISNSPNFIFAPFVSNLAVAMEIAEKKEVKEYLDKISVLPLSELDNIQNGIKKIEYSSESEILIDKAVNQRRLVCERELLDKDISDLANMDRQQIAVLYKLVEKKNYNRELISEYLSVLQKQNDFLEEKELRELCSNMEEKDISMLNSVLDIINKGNFQEKFLANYYNLIENKIKFLHVQNMERICANIDSCNRDRLVEIKSEIDLEQCISEVKSRFYDLISSRAERLDYEELCDLTNGCGEKALNELEALERTLSDGSYNDKFIKEFLLKVRVAKEWAQQQYMVQLVDGLQTMSKTQVIETKDIFNKLGYPDRIRFKFDEAILERLYELELQELILKMDDFNSLTLSQIAELRSSLQQQNLLDRSKEIYCSKLREREWIIACNMVSPFACLMKICIEQGGGDMNRFVLATFDQRYETYYKHFIDKNGEDIKDIPIVFIPDMNGLAFSKNYVFYQKSGEYKKIGINEIRSFSSERKFLSNTIHMTLYNNETNSFPSKGKTGQTMVNILHAYLQNRSNKAYLAKFSPYNKLVEPFTTDNMNIHHIDLNISVNSMIELFVKKLRKVNVLTGFKTLVESNWISQEKKVINGFEIQSESRILIYYDKTFFNTAKEGFAVGINNIYIKNANQPLILIPYNEFFNMRIEGTKLCIETVKNQLYTIDLSFGKNDNPDSFVELLESLAKGIQLFAVGTQENKDFTANISQRENSIKCPVCGAINRNGAKFCSSCGESFISQNSDNSTMEYLFCTECGNKYVKGKKYCSKCGSKLN